MLDCDCRSPLRDAIERFNLIEPLAVFETFLQIEARRSSVAVCTAPVARFDRHSFDVRPLLEQNKNMISLRRDGQILRVEILWSAGQARHSRGK
jgi:hypothetical protein